MQRVGLRLLTRSATNTYFAQVAAVISLPVAEDKLTELVSAGAAHDRHWCTEPAISQIAMARLSNPQVSATLQGYSDADVFERLQRLREGVTTTAAKDPKVAEFELLASGRKLIGENKPDARLHAETLDRDVWDPESASPLCAGIASLVAVHRLQGRCHAFTGSLVSVAGANGG